ncbi:hypothetical protein [Sagittula salina]|uniref:Uncharacterized protein n=1 Tax=Sagittula salina TaxID=2820268 RepID=A0A940MNH6_9RHOB|nr:hypothetical protein [Sagittula salina]MBP0485155.1 hypothetical protein [Sagittula salina]
MTSQVEATAVMPKSNKAHEDEMKKTSLRLRRKTLKALRIRAIEEDTSIQKLIERLIENYIDESRK